MHPSLSSRLFQVPCIIRPAPLVEHWSARQAIRQAARKGKPRGCAVEMASLPDKGSAASSSGGRLAPLYPGGEVDPDQFHMGPGTLRVSRRLLHHEIRRRLVDRLTGMIGTADAVGIVLLQGGSAFHLYSSDGEMLFRQESYFHYLFGVAEEDWFGALDLRTGAATLFMPRLPLSYAVWMGPLKGPEFFQTKYGVDAVAYVDELPAVLHATGAPCLHLLAGVNTDSGRTVSPACFEGIHGFTQETKLLFDALNECRVRKTEAELEVIAYANRLGSAAHVAVMQAARPGLMEYQLESVFLHACYSRGGSRQPMYTPIAASGPNASILHYGHAAAPNDRQLQPRDFVLADFGCEYYHYGSDITATWPVSGKFEEADHRAVYETVLCAHGAVLAALKPGVLWPDMQTLAYSIILEGLLALGAIRGQVEQLLQADVAALFMPHGRGVPPAWPQQLSEAPQQSMGAAAGQAGVAPRPGKPATAGAPYPRLPGPAGPVLVEPGDVVVLGTDGVFDNLWEDELVQLVQSALAAQGKAAIAAGGPTLAAAARRLAMTIAGAAHSHSRDASYRSPWAVEAAALDPGNWMARIMRSERGGKMDDITAVVAIVAP